MQIKLKLFNKTSFQFGIALILWGLTALAGLKFGAVGDPSFEVIYHLRLPRVLLASAIGMGLSVAGAVLQALFSNPLCEPYTLGIAAGAALGAVVGMSLKLDTLVAGLALSGFSGAMVFMALLFFASFFSKVKNSALLLTGVLLNFFGTSCVTLWVAVSDPQGVQASLIWLFGDLSRARLSGALFTGIAGICLFLLIWRQWRELDGLLIGEEGASTLGIDVPQVRRKLVFLSSFLIGICVSAGGMIGFVGLIIPHFARSFVGSLHRVLLPMSAILGAFALTSADWMSRWMIRPYELPIGVVTALVGSPAFLWIILKTRSQGR